MNGQTVAATLGTLLLLTSACHKAADAGASRSGGEADKTAAQQPDGGKAISKGVPMIQERAGPLKLTSLAFTDGGSIPPKYTCEGEDASPPLTWSGVPEGTKSLVLIVDDPDAPDPAAPKVTWVHWVLYNIPPRLSGLTGNATRIGLPAGIETGLNSWQRRDYGGPCPPIGRHRYFHKLYALDITLSDLRRPSKNDLLVAIEGHVLASATLMGTYQKRSAPPPPTTDKP